MFTRILQDTQTEILSKMEVLRSPLLLFELVQSFLKIECFIGSLRSQGFDNFRRFSMEDFMENPQLTFAKNRHTLHRKQTISYNRNNGKFTSEE